MIAIMYDGLELGKFVLSPDNILTLELNDNVKKSWLPYIFEIALDKDADTDMNKVIDIWVKERVFPKNRFGSKKMLKELGLKKYDVNKIAELTRCSLITDPYWLVYEETDRYTTHSIRGKYDSEEYPYNSLGIEEEGYIWRI